MLLHPWNVTSSSPVMFNSSLFFWKTCGFKVPSLLESLFLSASFSAALPESTINPQHTYLHTRTRSHTYTHVPINTSLLGTAKAQNDYRFSVDSATKLCKPLVYAPVLFWHSCSRHSIGVFHLRRNRNMQVWITIEKTANHAKTTYSVFVNSFG